MILRSRCSVIWTGLLIIIGSVYGEVEECLVEDKSNGTGNVNCGPQMGMYGFEGLNQREEIKRRSYNDYDDMNKLPTLFTEEGKSSDGEDKLSKSVTLSAVKNANNAFRGNQKGPKMLKLDAVGKNVYQYKEQLGGEPLGCGFPICVEVDMIPKRFTSMCAFAKWMKETNQQNRVFMVQKQDCAFLIDKKGPYQANLKKGWAKKMGNANKAKQECMKHEGCNTKICINDDGLAKTFSTVWMAMDYLKGFRGNTKEEKQNEMKKMRNRQLIAVGMGDCGDLYQKGCINTEWFDLDDPVSDDVEEESVPYAHQLVLSSDPGKMRTRFTNKGKETTMISEESQEVPGGYPGIKAGPDGIEIWPPGKRPHRGIHRSCSPERILGDAEFRTTADESNIPTGQPGSHYSDTLLAYKCKHHRNPEPLPKQFSWDIVKKNVTCRDWKFRYCCKEMWGEGESLGNMIRVDRPARKELFEGCKWKQYMNIPKIEGKGDNEAKEMYITNQLKLKGRSTKSKDNVCKGFALGTRFIDVRTNNADENLPYDEVPHQNILKMSAVYGFICLGKNCKDYKVKYCCNQDTDKIQTGAWGKWTAWSKCDQSCEGGIQKRTRNCPAGEGECFATMDNPKEQTKPCNEDIECPADGGNWKPWGAWSDCSKTCGPGTQTRYRHCKGQDCPQKRREEKKMCRAEKCPQPMWGPWGSWAGCGEQCDKVSVAIRKRKCKDKANYDKITDYDECEGGKEAATETGGKCPYAPCAQDGNWSEWDNWGYCDEFCQKTRRRFCDNPPQKGKGKPCDGPSEESQKCNDPPKGKKCPTVEPCKFSEWGQWSSCSLTCGDPAKAHEGVRIRVRHVMSKDVKKCQGKEHIVKQMKECIHCKELGKHKVKSPEEYGYMKKTCVNFCPSDCVYGPWALWSERCIPCKEPGKKYIEVTEHTRIRKIAKEAQHGGLKCDPSTLKQTEKCPEAGPCDNWKPWTEWTHCSSGGNCKSAKGVQHRKRSCKKGKKCPIGPSGKPWEMETKPGCLYLCKETDPYEEWSDWSPCASTNKEKNGEPCGVGKRSRSRKCQDFIAKTGGEEAVKKFCRHGAKQDLHEQCFLGPCNGYATYSTR